ncbi:MAG: helix-turn-helix transcriptional regulator, partial [Acidobacteriota bacterium]
MKRKTKAESFAPLSDVVFQLLVILHDGERHGYRLAKQLQGKLGKRRIAPGNLYRTLRSMLDQGLIEESGWRPDPGIDDERRRYFCITD